MNALNLNVYNDLAKYCKERGYSMVAYGDGRNRVKVINPKIPKYTVVSYTTSSHREIIQQLKELEPK